MSAATYANEGSKPREDYCNIWVFAERKTENNINSNTAVNDSTNIVAANDKSDSCDSNGNADYETYFWNDVRGTVFEKDLNDAYEKIVHWKRNLFMMPSSAVGKKYIEELTRLLKLWIQDSPLKSIALKAIHDPLRAIQHRCFRNLVKIRSRRTI